MSLKMSKLISQMVKFFVVALIGLVSFSSYAFDLNDIANAAKETLKPTKIDRESYKPTCKKEWLGKTIYIDFDTTRSCWDYRYASNLALTIRDRLIEDVVEDGCFHVQDVRTGKRYSYMVGVTIANPSMQVNNRTIRHVSAAFRIKTYDSQDNLITAKTRDVKYDSPAFTVSVNNSQDELLENYAYNVSVNIRKEVYESFK